MLELSKVEIYTNLVILDHLKMLIGEGSVFLFPIRGLYISDTYTVSSGFVHVSWTNTLQGRADFCTALGGF